VKAFEEAFARYLGVRHCVGVANGTDALTIALRAVGVKPGDDVVLPSFTFYATAEAVVTAGARPVFCDIDPATFCVTGETVAAAITSRTRAIVPVHLFGNVAPVDELEQFGVPVVEDAAQAAGATYRGRRAGALGTVATFSFFPSKNLPCLGEVSRGDLDLMAVRLERAHDRPHDQHVRAVRQVDPDAHARITSSTCSRVRSLPIGSATCARAASRVPGRSSASAPHSRIAG
jgi:hypothetical protein